MHGELVLGGLVAWTLGFRKQVWATHMGYVKDLHIYSKQDW